MAALIQFKGSAEGVTLRLENQLSRIGRGSESDITINDELVSKSHATIEARPVAGLPNVFEYFAEDCDSTNGTFVNDEKIERVRLRHDDVIRIGMNHFRFVDDANDDLAATTKIHKTWIPGIYVSKREK